MVIRSYVSSAVTIGVVVVVALVVLGHVLGQPILLGFVTTGSMSPTLEAGDGFIAVPPALAGGVEVGDVVTYDAQELEGGGLTTHRIVGQTREGYITQGDANPFTDQDGSEPPVLRTQIVAVALAVNGDVVVIPEFGTAVMALQGAFESVAGPLSAVPGLAVLVDGGLGSVMIGLGLFILAFSFVADFLAGGRRSVDTRSRSRDGVISAPLLLLAVILIVTIPATASMVIPSETAEFQVISSDSPSADDPLVIERGGSQEITYNATTSGLLPQVIIIEPASEGVTVSRSVLEISQGDGASSVVTVSVPAETGVFPRAVSVSHYVRVLPTSVIASLHAIHPWVALLGINLFLAAVVTVMFGLLVGFGSIRIRSTGRSLAVVDRLRRKLP